MEITDTLYAFARLADEGTIEQIGELLTADIEWAMAGTTWRGRAQVLDGLRSMRALGHAGPDSGNRHVVTNQEVRAESDRATAHAYFLLVSRGAPAAILAVGSYRDELRRVTGRWLIARREVAS
ncbi:nuclear transport factor 2 family protein [Allonocardiopsis opalescens]|uniref:SnoaL-like protein n=1 Tax=Allonocardiopsis opalescens TaxID=1144618 RepID=A0A2T0Q7I7_9ACTN|nr:nuclear transport factor 2 family protein [Allonocardiopsis opalescens]PRX99751.1 SnoaL-like protein [Allonocardiopsis opalescens]